jgi:hypothetical protein
MSEDPKHVDFLTVVMDGGHKTVFVPADIEDRHCVAPPTCPNRASLFERYDGDKAEFGQETNQISTEPPLEIWFRNYGPFSVAISKSC